MCMYRGKSQRNKAAASTIWVCQDCEVILDAIDGRKPRCPKCQREDTVVPLSKRSGRKRKKC